MVEIATDKDLAGINRKVIQHGPDKYCSFCPFQFLFDVNVVGDLVNPGCQLLVIRTSSSLLASPTQAYVPGKGCQPRSDASGIYQLVAVPPSLEERFLDKVFGNLSISRISQAEANEAITLSLKCQI